MSLRTAEFHCLRRKNLVINWVPRRRGRLSVLRRIDSARTSRRRWIHRANVIVCACFIPREILWWRWRSSRVRWWRGVFKNWRMTWSCSVWVRLCGSSFDDPWTCWQRLTHIVLAYSHSARMNEWYHLRLRGVGGECWCMFWRTTQLRLTIPRMMDDGPRLTCWWKIL